MDTVWERIIPFYNVNRSVMEAIFREFDHQIVISDAAPIAIGCRNSNYRVMTNKGNYLLRICPRNDEQYGTEWGLQERLDSRVRRPKLLFVSTTNETERPCLVYEFVDGVSLQTAIAGGFCLTQDIVVQVAQAAARIHNTSAYLELGFLNDKLRVVDRLPPFKTWFELFMGPNTTRRIGQETVAAITKFLAENDHLLEAIDQNYCLTHGDYRPANMLIDGQERLVVVDWEYVGSGHRLADVGQFFRYSGGFEKVQRAIFKEAYDREAKVQLPGNWYELCKLRDLVNLLQMLNDDREFPKKYEDLRAIILQTLALLQR